MPGFYGCSVSIAGLHPRTPAVFQSVCSPSLAFQVAMRSSSTDSRCLSVSLFTVSGLSGSNELRWNEEVLPGLKVVFYGEPGLGLV
jgi:hypothetical protein